MYLCSMCMLQIHFFYHINMYVLEPTVGVLTFWVYENLFVQFGLLDLGIRNR